MNLGSAAAAPKFSLATRRVVILLGAGGVGKTTSSVAFALNAALAGRRVALLSIDPAKRLAAALGIPLASELKPIDLSVLSTSEAPVKGTLDAAMLDQKAVFDTMVRRHAPSPGVAAKILAHPVYQAASTKLIGPLEYMALAKLLDLVDDPRYDLVVLDTPPDTHALDFLARPNVLAGFFENKVMTWLIKPFLLAGKLGLGRVFSAGEKLMGGIAKVMGVSALHSFADFLVLVQEVLNGFNASGERIVATLKRHDTSFVLVTVPEKPQARAAVNLARELSGLGYALDLVVFNRIVPTAVERSLASLGDEARRSAAGVALATRIAVERDVQRELMTTVAAGRATITVEEFDGDLATLTDLKRLAATYVERF